MQQTHYTREDFLKWFLEAVLLVPHQESWNEELWRKNPPRFYRFLRLDALAQALEIDCPLREVAAGKFIREPLSAYQGAWTRLVNLCPKQVAQMAQGNVEAGQLSLDDVQWCFSRLFDCRRALADVIGFNRGVLEASSVRALVMLFSTQAVLAHARQGAAILDQLLCEFMAPHNPQVSKLLLIEKYGFPDVDVNAIDAEWA